MLLLCLLFIQDARSAESLDQASAMVARVSGAKVRPYSTRDFGREKYVQAEVSSSRKPAAFALLKEVRDSFHLDSSPSLARPTALPNLPPMALSW